MAATFSSLTRKRVCYLLPKLPFLDQSPLAAEELVRDDINAMPIIYALDLGRDMYMIVGTSL